MKPSPWFRKSEIYFYDLFGAWQGDFDCLSFIENLTCDMATKGLFMPLKKRVVFTRSFAFKSHRIRNEEFFVSDITVFAPIL